MTDKPLTDEWRLMQKQYDSYEFASLSIKLLSITLCAVAYLFEQMGIFVCSIIGLLWLQDAIWKTFQARIETHLVKLECALSNGGENVESQFTAYQFNTEYQQNRPSSAGLLKEYLSQALRPTVAFPHMALIIMVVLVSLF